MPEIRRELQFDRLNPFILRWINLFPPRTPFAVDELWNAAGHEANPRSPLTIPNSLASDRCKEYVAAGLLEELPDGRFRATPAFTPENIQAFKQGRSVSPSEAFDPSGRERPQKFPILLSLGEGRRLFSEAGEQCRAGRLPISVVFVDIDNFKRLNTQHSNAVVDRTILPEFMTLVQNASAYRAHVCLQGGDEIVMILPNCSKEEAAAFAERLRSRIEEHVFQVDDTSERFTISAGVATFPEHGQDFEGVMEAANGAEQLAKRRRNSIEIAE